MILPEVSGNLPRSMGAPYRACLNNLLPIAYLLGGWLPRARAKVRCPRVRDRGGVTGGDKIRFTSAILPRYLRRSKSVEELLPWLLGDPAALSEAQQIGRGALALAPRRSCRAI